MIYRSDIAITKLIEMKCKCKYKSILTYYTIRKSMWNIYGIFVG